MDSGLYNSEGKSGCKGAFLPHDAMLVQYMPSSCHCLCVFLSHCGIVWKWL